MELIQPILGLIIISSLIAITWGLSVHPLADNAKDIILMLIGVLAKSFSDVVNYYFGSTASSKTKDKTISDMVSSPPVSTPISIPNATSVKVDTKEGDVNVSQKEPANEIK